MIFLELNNALNIFSFHIFLCSKLYFNEIFLKEFYEIFR